MPSDMGKPAVRICAFVAEFTDLPPDKQALTRLEEYAKEIDWRKPMQSFYLKFPHVLPEGLVK